MQMGVVSNNSKFRVTPNRRFWEYDLELPIERLMDEYSNPNLRQNWLESLSPRQVTMLYAVNQVEADVSKALPVAQMRKTLMEQSDDLFNYYLVNRFNHAKLETAVSDIAKTTLSDDLLEFCLVKNNKYDKKSLLFALFNQNPDALKNIYHYDKIHKKGFAAFVLLNPPRQQATTFADFISSYPISKILEQYNLNLGDGFESQLQDTFVHAGRIYLFIRRASDEDVLLSSDQLLHGHKPEWTIIDFADNGKQVNICAKCPQKSVFIANALISEYFNQSVTFTDAADVNFKKQVERFLRLSASESDQELKLFEIRFRSPYFHNNTEIAISTCPHNSIAEDLKAMQGAAGDVLADITCVDSIKVLYQNKRITLYFRCLDEACDHIRICYSEHVLDKNAREIFKSWMRDTYGLTILPKAKCCN